MPGKAHVIAIATIGKSVFIGTNKWKSHPASLFSIHAEVNAISQISLRDRPKAKLYVFRLLGTGGLAMARPCKKCRTYIRSLGIQDVYYSTEEGTIVYERFSEE